MKIIKNFFIKYYIILLGFFIITAYLWMRFLRSHETKVLPYKITVPNFFILVYICCIFAFILYSLIRKTASKKDTILEIILDFIFTPIKELEIFIRNISFIKKRSTIIYNFLKPILDFCIINTHLFFIIFWLLPRLILLTALFIDVFIFHQFHYKYQVILFGILLFLNRYIKYALKNIKKELLIGINFYIEQVTTKYVSGIHPSEWPENFDPDAEEEDDDDDDFIFMPRTMTLPIDIFIKFQINSIVYQDIARDYIFDTTDLLRKKLWLEIVEEPYVFYRFTRENPLPKDYKNKFGNGIEGHSIAKDKVFKAQRKLMDVKYQELLTVGLWVEYLNKTNNDNVKFKNIKILIYTNYLMCWLYILIISLPYVPTDAIFDVLINTYQNTPEPFSNNTIR